MATFSSFATQNVKYSPNYLVVKSFFYYFALDFGKPLAMRV